MEQKPEQPPGSRIEYIKPSEPHNPDSDINWILRQKRYENRDPNRHDETGFKVLAGLALVAAVIFLFQEQIGFVLAVVFLFILLGMGGC